MNILLLKWKATFVTFSNTWTAYPTTSMQGTLRLQTWITLKMVEAAPLSAMLLQQSEDNLVTTSEGKQMNKQEIHCNITEF